MNDSNSPAHERQKTNRPDKLVMMIWFIVLIVSGIVGLVFVLVISSVIGLFYYLRLIGIMMKKEKGKVAEAKTSLIFSGVFVLAVLGALIVWLGIYPTWLLELVNNFIIAL